MKVFIQVLFGGDNRRVLLHVLTPPLSSMPLLPAVRLSSIFVRCYLRHEADARWGLASAAPRERTWIQQKQQRQQRTGRAVLGTL